MKKIYLDLNFINHLGDGKRDNWGNSKYKPLYSELVKGVTSKKIICPGSSPVFFELSKQDLDTILSGSVIVDEISQGLCILSKYRIIQHELTNLMEYIKSEKTKTDFNNDPIWGKGGMIIDLDENTIQSKVNPLHYDTILKLIKSETWVGLFTKYGKQIKENGTYNSALPEIAKNLQDHKEKMKDEITKFNKLQHFELISTIKASINLFPEITNDFAFDERYLDMNSLIKLQKIIPFMYAFASIHALIGYDKRRKMRPNDTYDIDHCSIGLAYYDIIFTERSFNALMKDRLASLNIIYDVELAKSPEEAMEILQRENEA